MRKGQINNLGIRYVATPYVSHVLDFVFHLTEIQYLHFGSSLLLAKNRPPLTVVSGTQNGANLALTWRDDNPFIAV